jgi:hypothetical protein
MHDALRDCSSKAEQATRSNCHSPIAEGCLCGSARLVRMSGIPPNWDRVPRRTLRARPASAIAMSGQEELGGSLTKPATAGQPSARGVRRRPCGSEALPLDCRPRQDHCSRQARAPSVRIDPLARSVKPKCLCVLSGSASASSGCYSRAMRRIPFAAADDRARPGAGLFHDRRSAMAKGCVGDLAEVHRADTLAPPLGTSPRP